jgi:hypoxanthine phosphoribosyltransferase
MSEVDKSTTTSVTMRLPNTTIEKITFIEKTLGNNKTQSVITAINLAFLILQEQAKGKKVVIIDEKTDQKESIHFV